MRGRGGMDREFAAPGRGEGDLRSVGIEDTTYAGDWPRVVCTRSYVSIPAYRTRHNIIRKRGCEAGQGDERTRLDWRGRQFVYVYASMCDTVMLRVCTSVSGGSAWTTRPSMDSGLGTPDSRSQALNLQLERFESS